MDPLSTAIIAAVVGSLFGGIVGAITGYYTAKKLDLEKETRGEKDRIRDELLAEYQAYQREYKSGKSIDNWLNRVEAVNQSSRVNRLLFFKAPVADRFILKPFQEYEAKNSQLISDFTGRMPKNPSAKPFYYEQMQEALEELYEDKQTLEKQKVEIEAYLEQQEDAELDSEDHFEIEEEEE